MNWVLYALKKKRQGREMWRIQKGGRNKIWGGGWYLGWGGNISLVFHLSSPLPSSLSIALHSSPWPSSWECLGADPASAPGVPLQCPVLRAGGMGPSCHALPRGQRVCSGRACSSEWASLQFHYSGNWLKWKLYLMSRGAPATTWEPETERERKRDKGG